LKNYSFSKFNINKKQTLGIYNSIIGSKLLVSGILSKISKKSFTNNIKSGEKQFQKLIEKFKKNNK
jgi:hypothetical protein